jgi:glycerol transport system permease protein
VKTVNQRAWFLVLPVFAIVLFSALLPLMTVVNYSVQDSFGNNQFFWNGIGWFQELMDPSSQLGERFFDSLWRNLLFSSSSRCRSGSSWPSRCRARAGRCPSALWSWLFRC